MGLEAEFWTRRQRLGPPGWDLSLRRGRGLKKKKHEKKKFFIC